MPTRFYDDEKKRNQAIDNFKRQGYNYFILSRDSGPTDKPFTLNYELAFHLKKGEVIVKEQNDLDY